MRKLSRWLLLTIIFIVLGCGGGGGGTATTDPTTDPPADPPADPIFYIKASDADLNDVFGSSVALSSNGGRLVVGAPAAAGDFDNVAGKVYIYDWNTTAWAQFGSVVSGELIQGANPGRFELFGDAVAISADGLTIAGGGPWAAGQVWQGNVHVFVYNGTTIPPIFELQETLQGTYVQTEDRLGDAVALSDNGNTLAAIGDIALAAGAPGYVDVPGVTGAVQMFVRLGVVWSGSDLLVGSGVADGDGFGAAVAISDNGELIAIGAPGNDLNGLDAGAVYLFAWDGANWTERDVAHGIEIGGAFGSSVALVRTGANSATLAVGEPDAGNGSVHLLAWDGATLSATETLTASNGEAGDRFGSAVALNSGNATLLAVGADSEDSAATGIDGEANDNAATEAGAVYLFENGTGGWSQTSYLKASNTGAGDRLGASVAISAFGESLAAGAWGEDGSATNDGDDPFTDNSGAAYVY